jgi:hypothetical protein
MPLFKDKEPTPLQPTKLKGQPTILFAPADIDSATKVQLFAWQRRAPTGLVIEVEQILLKAVDETGLFTRGIDLQGVTGQPAADVLVLDEQVFSQYTAGYMIEMLNTWLKLAKSPRVIVLMTSVLAPHQEIVKQLDSAVRHRVIPFELPRDFAAYEKVVTEVNDQL